MLMIIFPRAFITNRRIYIQCYAHKASYRFRNAETSHLLSRLRHHLFKTYHNFCSRQLGRNIKFYWLIKTWSLRCLTWSADKPITRSVIGWVQSIFLNTTIVPWLCLNFFPGVIPITGSLTRNSFTKSNGLQTLSLEVSCKNYLWTEFWDTFCTIHFTFQKAFNHAINRIIFNSVQTSVYYHLKCILSAN